MDLTLEEMRKRIYTGIQGVSAPCFRSEKSLIPGECAYEAVIAFIKREYLKCGPLGYNKRLRFFV
jgi:hypothetical protein